MTEPSPATQQRRLLRIVLLTVFLDMIGFGIIIPQLPLYVEAMGGNAQVAGLLLTCFSITQLVATPILGRLSDSHGRRPVILISLAGNAVAMLLFAGASSLWMLFASRILAGATSGNFAACQAAIADVTSPQERAKGMGSIGAGISLGLVLGPTLGGLISQLGSWAPPTAAAALAGLDLLLAWIYMPETRFGLASSPQPGASPEEASSAPSQAPASRPAQPPSPGPSASDTPTRPASSPKPSVLWQALKNRQQASVLILYFLIFMVISNLSVSLAFLVKRRLGWGPDEVGYLFGLVGLVSLVVQFTLIGWLAKTLGEGRLLAAGSVLVALGMAGVGLSTAAIPLLLGLLLHAFGSSVITPSLSSLASRFASREQQGAVLGVAQSAGGLGRVIGPSWSGFLFSRVSSGAPFYGASILALASVLIALSLGPVASEDQPPTPAA